MHSDNPNWNDSAERRHLMRLARVTQAIASAVVMTDAQGITTWVNDGFTRITGYSLEEAVGRTPGQLLQGPDTDRGAAARIGAALRARQSVSAELINYAKNGRRYWVGMKIEPLFDDSGELDGFMAIEADITERHEHNRSMELLARRFDMATRAARVGVIERDPNGEIAWWNDVMYELLDQDAATFKPTIEAWLALIHPDDRERMRENVRGLALGLNGFDWRYRIIRADGEIRYLRALGAPAEREGAAVRRFAGITLDITERIRGEERERALQERLRESSHQAGMAEIATGVLHNVGNVLNSLGIANSKARREFKGLRLERLEQATALLLDNKANLSTFLSEHDRGRHLAEYLAALAKQIADNARSIQSELETTEQLLHHLGDIVSAQQELARVGGRSESIRLNELMETALLVQASELARIEVVREYAELPPINADRHKLLQILVNLVSNACDAVAAAGPERARILVKLALDGNDVLVTVEDSGIGMSEEVLSQLWRFGFTTKKKGHGFGLHNSANAAHEIGATLTAHSEGVGRGSRFVLRIPIGLSQSMPPGVAA